MKLAQRPRERKKSRAFCYGCKRWFMTAARHAMWCKMCKDNWRREYDRARYRSLVVRNAVERSMMREGLADKQLRPGYEPDAGDEEFVATEALPGSAEKIDELRVRRGFPLWHKGDRRYRQEETQTGATI